MSRLLPDADRRRGRSAPPDADSCQPTEHGRSTIEVDHVGSGRLGDRRDDRSGRRSLTGLEFRRRGSI
jgi:hypothetical protein